MEEKYFFIEPETARKLFAKINDIEPTKRGIDSKAYLFDEYAVLSSDRIKLRNYATHDDDLAYFDELIATVMRLNEQGVAVVPILGYCYDKKSENGTGYIFQKRAKGEELYDDSIMQEFYAWAQSDKENYLSGNSSKGAAKEYIISRTNFVSRIPQEHFDKLMKDIITLANNDILIDFMGKSNFFYDESAGFQFIDINSHTDYKYGLDNTKFEGSLICAYNGFVPCHIAAGSKVLSGLALDEKAVSILNENELVQLKADNNIIFGKCRTAMLNNGVTKDQLGAVFQGLKLFGVET